MTVSKRQNGSDVCAHTSKVMEGIDWAMGRKCSEMMSSTPFKLQTPHDVLDNHQELYQAYLNKIIQSAQHSHGDQLLKFEGEKGASINFKLLLEVSWPPNPTMTLTHPVQHAMAGMKRDHDTYNNEEFDEVQCCRKIDSPILGSEDLPSMPKKVASRDSKASRPPSLAATHPASYMHHTQHVLQTIPPPPAPKKIKLEPVIKSEWKHERLPRQPLPLCQQIHDPKLLTSREPTVDDPMYRHLSCDTRSDAPYVISPSFMIAMPLGTLIEGANYWPSKDHQPRDFRHA